VLNAIAHRYILPLTERTLCCYGNTHIGVENWRFLAGKTPVPKLDFVYVEIPEVFQSFLGHSRAISLKTQAV
jgi:hypothetical protein